MHKSRIIHNLLYMLRTSFIWSYWIPPTSSFAKMTSCLSKAAYLKLACACANLGSIALGYTTKENLESHNPIDWEETFITKERTSSLLYHPKAKYEKDENDTPGTLLVPSPANRWPWLGRHRAGPARCGLAPTCSPIGVVAGIESSCPTLKNVSWDDNTCKLIHKIC